MPLRALRAQIEASPSASPRLPALLRMLEQRHAEEPPLDHAGRLVVACWVDLAGERRVWGDMLGPIPYSAIRTWADDHGLDDDSRLLVLRAIQHADAERSRVAASRARLAKQPSPVTKGRKP